MAIVKSRRARNWMLAIALSLLIGALLWRAQLESEDELSKLAGRLRELGCEVYGADFYVQGDYQNATIAELLPEADMQMLIEASTASGFPSDVHRDGDVVLLLARLEDGGILTVYMLDGEPELCFIQSQGSSEVRPVGEKAS